MVLTTLPPTDKEGFLVNLDDWSETVAVQLADNEALSLSEDHWAIINLVRGFYREFKISPAMRVLVKAVKLEFGKEKGRSIYLHLLFPDNPAKLISKIAGLPKPINCD